MLIYTSILVDYVSQNAPYFKYGSHPTHHSGGLLKKCPVQNFRPLWRWEPLSGTSSSFRKLVVVVKMLKFGHFRLKIGPLCFWNLTQNPWDYETRAQELTSGAIRMLLSFFVKIWEFFKDGRVWGFYYQMNFVVNFDIFYNFWYISALDELI